MTSDNNFWAPLYRAFSSLSDWSKSNIFVPASNYNTIPEVTTGDIPNSISVPLLEAKITLIQ